MAPRGSVRVLPGQNKAMVPLGEKFPYNPLLADMSLSLREGSKHASVERYSIAVITVKEGFPKVRRYLEPTFRTILAETEQQIQAAFHNCELRTNGHAGT